MSDKFNYDRSPELAPRPTGTPAEKKAPTFDTDEVGERINPYPNSPGMTGNKRYGDGRSAGGEGDEPTQAVGQQRFSLRYRDGREVPVFYPDLKTALRSGAYLDFRRSILDNQIVELSDCYNQDFGGASMRNCQLVGKFTICDFSGADLRGARLSGTFGACEFGAADFDGATITDADFSGSFFKGAKNLDRAKGAETAVFDYTDVDVRDLGASVAEPEEEEPAIEEPEEEPEGETTEEEPGYDEEEDDFSV